MLLIDRVGQNRIYTPYMTVYLVISLPKIPNIHRIYIGFWPTLLIDLVSNAGSGDHAVGYQPPRLGAF